MKGLNNPAQYKQNRYYIKYEKQKLKIKDKYKNKIDFSDDKPGPRKPVTYERAERELYQAYLKKVGDLLMKPNGNFQKFMWDIMSDNDKLIQERKARGKKTYSFQ